MPIWRTYRGDGSDSFDSNTSQLVLANLNEYDQKKSFEIDGREHPYLIHRRPQTSHGTTSHSRHQEIITPGLSADHDFSYLSSMTWSSASASTNDLSTNDSSGSIGIALGYPSIVRRSQLATHTTPPLKSNGSPMLSRPAAICGTSRPLIGRVHTAHPQIPIPSTRKELPPPPGPSPKLRRWRTVGGLLKRVKTQKQKHETSIQRPSTSAGHGETKTSRPQSIKSFKARSPIRTNSVREQAWGQLPKKSKIFQRAKMTDSKRTLESGFPTPHLNIAIPDASLDRYSVMFSDVLNDVSKPSPTVKRTILTRRQNGIDNLTIISPSYAPDEGTSLKRMPSVRGRKPPKKALSLFPAVSPQPDSSPHTKQLSNNPLRRSKSAIGLLTTPTEDSFLKISSTSPKRAKSERMPHTPPLDAYFKHFPIPNTEKGSPATFEEAWDSSGLLSELNTIQSNHDESKLVERSQSLHQHKWRRGHEESSAYLQSPHALTSAFSDPSSYSPHSFLAADTSPHVGNLTAPSPGLRHGYDAPHSPCVEVARQVCVTNVQSARTSVHLPAQSARTSVHLVESHPHNTKNEDRKKSVHATTGKGSVSALGTASRAPTIVERDDNTTTPRRRRSFSAEVEDVEGVWVEVETAWGVRESKIGLGVLV